MKKNLSIVSVITLALFFSIGVVNTATAVSSSSTTNGKSQVTQKLTETKLKVCQNKQAALQKRNDQLTKMAENMMTKFDGIATRVETYYTDKVLPSGKTVSNYDALVADIATKKTVVKTDLDKASVDSKAFDCTSSDPKGQLTQFRTDMQTVKGDLKNYRTSIKDLIVAVRSVNGETESTTNPTTD